ncbi:hypothetical protein J2W20_001470 [Sinomonas atrocyanea]|uniref:hypothetical protein n=1 Tax=Sinomonas atrocyanea TaxID=37927 RepID=UPI002789FAB3|nr:hypothetical protein [Sinomonas atrocyanea]MDQ0259579.1 hypothetical protein [Sinomonas atrocyanea]
MVVEERVLEVLDALVKLLDDVEMAVDEQVDEPQSRKATPWPATSVSRSQRSMSCSGEKPGPCTVTRARRVMNALTSFTARSLPSGASEAS